jgi:hypothetical protein
MLRPGKIRVLCRVGEGVGTPDCRRGCRHNCRQLSRGNRGTPLDHTWRSRVGGRTCQGWRSHPLVTSKTPRHSADREVRYLCRGTRSRLSLSHSRTAADRQISGWRQIANLPLGELRRGNYPCWCRPRAPAASAGGSLRAPFGLAINAASQTLRPRVSPAQGECRGAHVGGLAENWHKCGISARALAAMVDFAEPPVTAATGSIRCGHCALRWWARSLTSCGAVTAAAARVAVQDRGSTLRSQDCFKG